jgi:capsular exopolysaccharide synthesis family protein
MGKVYDALRRAEEQRQGLARGTAAPLEPRQGRTGAPAPRERSGGLAALRRLLRRDAAPAHAGDDANSINKRRISLLHPESFVAEQFRTLRARLDSLAAERPLRTIALTSAVPDEGKTTAAVNLALVSAMSVGRRVILVDCDLRRPGVHSSLGLRPEFGLAEVLNEQVPVDRAICKVDGCSLDVLPVRGTPSNPSELLASSRMRALLEELSQRYDQVLLDTPPTLSLPDAKTLSQVADGVILVVRADETPAEEVEAALDILDRRRLLGVVLNGAESDARRYGY